VNQEKHRKTPYTDAECAKAFKDQQRAERESACQPSTSNAATAAHYLMELHIEKGSADTDMNMDEPTGAVWVQLRAPEVRAPTRDLW
jgi:phage FluMu gp28-like protein